MTPRALIAAFETLADAPDGVKRLRELVLHLAVRGKLLPQAPEEVPASEVLKQIAADRAKISEKLRTRLPKSLPPVSAADQLYDIPPCWQWCRLQDIGVIVAGSTPSSSDADNFCEEGGYPWLTPADMRAYTKGKFISRGARNLTERGLKSCSAQLMPAGSVVFSSRAPIGYVAIAANPLCTNQGFKSIVPATEELSEFLRIYLLYSGPLISAIAPGTTFKEVSGAFMSVYPVPIPPLAEQRRIVERVDELMGLLDRLEAARTARDEVRRAARDAALAALGHAEDAEAAKTAWARLSDQMDALFTDPEDVAPLRQIILQIAVKGRIVQSEVTSVPLNDVVDPERPVSYGVLVPGADVPDGVPLVRIADLHPTSPSIKPEKCIAPDVAAAYERVRLRGDELLLGVVGSIGKVGVARAEWAGAVVARAVVRMGVKTGVSRDYIRLVLQSPIAQEYFREATRTLAQPTLNVSLIRITPIPLPSLEDQEQIVAKVDALMAICDQLEARLTAARELQAQFAAAAVHHLDV